MTDTTVHVAGPAVSVKGRVVQRCNICGLKLVDWEDKDWVPGAEKLTPPEGTPEPSLFTESAYVRERTKDGVVLFSYVPVPEDEDPNLDYPADGCLHLVEPGDPTAEAE